jgi:hypothetical protein
MQFCGLKRPVSTVTDSPVTIAMLKQNQQSRTSSTLLFFAAVFLCIRTAECIVQGTVDDGNQFPMACAILREEKTLQAWDTACTGTLVTPSKLVTAAHCATANATHVSCASRLTGSPTTVEIEGFDTFPFWNILDTAEAREDIAVLTLKTPVEGAVLATLPSQDFLSFMNLAGKDVTAGPAYSSSSRQLIFWASDTPGSCFMV